MLLALSTIFTVSYFLHLTARFPLLGAIRFDLLLGLAYLALAFLQPQPDIFRFSEKTGRRLNLFLMYVLLSLPLVTWPGSVIKFHLDDWVKAAFFYLLVVGTVRTEKKLYWIMLVFIACQVFRAMEPLYLHVTKGYWGDVAYSHVGGVMSSLDRLSGAPHDVVNPNQLAWVIVTTVPFLFYLLWLASGWGKLLFLMLFSPMAYALLLTGSRSGLLSLAVTFLAMVAISKHKQRNFIVILLLLLVAVPLLGHLTSGLQARYLSLLDSSQAGGDTAQGRVNALVLAIRSVADNPLFGHGLGTSGETNYNVMGASSQITHNLYLEILQEIGVIGLFLFLSIAVSIVRTLREAKMALLAIGDDRTSWLFRLLSALQVWVAMDLFYSLSCFGLRSWEWYFFGGIATSCKVFVQQRYDQARPATEGGTPSISRQARRKVG